MFSKINLAVLALLILGVTLSFGLVRKLSAHNASSQPQYPIMVNLKKYPAWMEPPIQVTEIRVQSKRVELDLPFQHSEDWLRDFSVVVKNISDKQILGIALHLEWSYDTTDNMPYLPETLLYAGPDFLMDPEGAGRRLFLNPGESVELFVEKSWWDTHNNHIAGKAHELHKQLPETIRRSATLKYEHVYFDTDNAWFKGIYCHRDLNNKNRFIPDETQRKKISHFLKQYGKEAKPMFASYTPNRRLPGCERFDYRYLVNCTP